MYKRLPLSRLTAVATVALSQPTCVSTALPRSVTCFL